VQLTTFSLVRYLPSVLLDTLLTHALAVMDAHSRANTLHRNLSPDNIILLRLPGKQIRVGYLINWELSCKTDRVTVRNHVLTVGSFMFSKLGC